MVCLFIVCVALLFHVFLVYPVVLMLMARRHRDEQECRYEPRVAVIVCAYNEADNIAGKVSNILACRYPADKMEILVASDGSADGTDQVVRDLHHPRVRLISLAVHEGKTAAVNAAALEARADILVFSDADTLIREDAIGQLVKHFADPQVGAVCGRRSEKSGGAADVATPARLYNLYEGAIKRGEGAIGRVLGCDGCLYALRRESFRPLPTNVPDDFVNALRVLEEGKRVCYEPEALSWETLSNSATEEFQRKRRTVARGIRGLWSVRGLLNPFRFPLIALMLVSHKILRWCAGCIMLALLVITALLIARPFFRWFLIAQTIVYATVFLGGMGARGRLWLPSKAIRFFVFVNLASTAGILDVMLKRGWTSWTVQRART